MVGSGGLVAMNEQDLHGEHRAVLHGFHPARELRQMRAVPGRHAPDAGMLDDIIEGRATGETLELMEKLALGRAERLALRPG